MNLSSQIATVVFAVTGAFFTGRFCGAPTVSGTDVRSPGAISSPAPARTHAPDQAGIVEQDAKVRALVAMLDAGGYDQPADFFAATRNLNLADIRDLHERAMQMSNNAALLDITAARLVELDPAAALARVREIGDGQKFLDPTKLLIWWAIKTPEAAIEEGLKNPLSGKGRQLLISGFAGLAWHDPAGAIARLSSIPDPKSRSETLGVCLRNWTRSNPVEAATWMKAHPEVYASGSEGNDAVATFASSLAMRDPALGRDFAQGLQEPLRGQALRYATTEWAMQDPKTALAWCMENGIPMNVQEEVWSRGTRYVDSVIACAMTKAPESTLAWMETIPVEVRAELAPEALRSASAAMAERIFGFIAEDDQPENAASLMRKLNKRRSGDAMKWATKLPEGPVRVAALSELMGRYIFSDAVKEIDGFAAGKSRDAAYVSHIERTARSGASPDVSIIPKIADPELRADAAGTVYQSLRRSDPDTAKKWLSTTPHLSAEEKQQLGGSDK